MTAVEMGATLTVRCNVLKGEAARLMLRGPRFRHYEYSAPPEGVSPRRVIAAMGLPINEDGVNEGGNLTLALPQRSAPYDRHPWRARIDPGAVLRRLQRCCRPQG